MANKLPWMPFFGSDFYGDSKVQAMTDRQEAWYIRLLWEQWKHGTICTLEQSVRKVASPAMGTKAEEWGDFYQWVTEGYKGHDALFPSVDEYRGQNPRLEELRQEQIAKHESYQKRGRSGGLATAQTQQGSSLDPSPTNSSTPSSALQRQNQNQKQRQKGEKSEAAGAPADDFADMMGLIREVWKPSREEQVTNGSILKALLRKGKHSPEFEAAVRGLPLILPDSRHPSMKWLYAKGCATDVFKKAVDAHYEQEKGPVRKREGEGHDPQHISAALDRIGVAR